MLEIKKKKKGCLGRRNIWEDKCSHRERHGVQKVNKRNKLKKMRKNDFEKCI